MKFHFYLLTFSVQYLWNSKLKCSNVESIIQVFDVVLVGKGTVINKVSSNLKTEKFKELYFQNKNPVFLNGHLSMKYFTVTRPKGFNLYFYKAPDRMKRKKNVAIGKESCNITPQYGNNQCDVYFYM